VNGHRGDDLYGRHIGEVSGKVFCGLGHLGPLSSRVGG